MPAEQDLISWPEGRQSAANSTSVVPDTDGTPFPVRETAPLTGFTLENGNIADVKTILASTYTLLGILATILQNGTQHTVVDNPSTGYATSAAQTTAQTSLTALVTAAGLEATAANQVLAKAVLDAIATSVGLGATAAHQVTAQTSLTALVTAAGLEATAANQTAAKTVLDNILLAVTGIATAAKQDLQTTALGLLATAAKQDTLQTRANLLATEAKQDTLQTRANLLATEAKQDTLLTRANLLSTEATQALVKGALDLIQSDTELLASWSVAGAPTTTQIDDGSFATFGTIADGQSAAPDDATTAATYMQKMSRMLQKATAILAVLPLALGAGTSAQSLKVVLPSDQTPVAIRSKVVEYSGGGSITAINQDILVSTDMSDKSFGTMQIAGTYVGIVSVQTSLDGTNFVTQNIHQVSNSNAFNNDLSTPTSGTTGMWVFPRTGKFYRIRMTSFTSNTSLSVTVNFSNDSSSLNTGGILAVNVAAINNAFLSTGNGTSGAGNFRVNVASDNTPFPITLAASTANGTSVSSLICTASTNATLVKNSAGTVVSITMCNNSATAAYLKLYDSSTIPTAGSGTPSRRYMIKPNDTVCIPFTPGQLYASGIGFTVTGGIADNDVAIVAASTFIIDIEYK